MKAVVPGAEVHDDPDVTWVVQPGSIWGNAAVMVRFSEEEAPDRLDTMVERYRRHGRGMGLWISPEATPAHLSRLLRLRRIHCRKRFPAMIRDLGDRAPGPAMPRDLAIQIVGDHDEFRTVPHPSIGAITTDRRRQMLDGLRALVASAPARIVSLVARLRGAPIGASLLFLGSECAGLHDLTVAPEHRGRGYGAALLARTCREAWKRGASTMALLATSDGQRLYERSGFSEVARFGYWFRSFQRAGRD
jgi:GNAT superfamily N-acetyltransferase